MAGQVVMQGFIRRRIPIFLRRAITLAPALLVLAIGVNPTDALVGSQVVLSFGIPFALVPLVIIASTPRGDGGARQPALADRPRRRVRRPDHRPQRLPARSRSSSAERPSRPPRQIGELGHATFSRFSTRCRPTGRTSSSTCGSTTRARYIDSAVALSQVNAQPYSKADWHWRLLVAHSFGHAAAAETVKGVLAKLDGEGVTGELRVARGARGPLRGRADVGPPGERARGVPPAPLHLMASTA